MLYSRSGSANLLILVGSSILASSRIGFVLRDEHDDGDGDEGNRQVNTDHGHELEPKVKRAPQIAFLVNARDPQSSWLASTHLCPMPGKSQQTNLIRSGGDRLLLFLVPSSPTSLCTKQWRRRRRRPRELASGRELTPPMVVTEAALVEPSTSRSAACLIVDR